MYTSYHANHVFFTGLYATTIAASLLLLATGMITPFLVPMILAVVVVLDFIHAHLSPKEIYPCKREGQEQRTETGYLQPRNSLLDRCMAFCTKPTPQEPYSFTLRSTNTGLYDPITHWTLNDKAVPYRQLPVNLQQRIDSLQMNHTFAHHISLRS